MHRIETMTSRPKILKVCAIDSTAWLLLRTQMQALHNHGWEVHIACSDGPRMAALAELGFKIHPMPIARNTNLLAHFRAVWRLFRLIHQERFAVVHVHTPIASLLGRIAARMARTPLVLYTAHGFYFHDEMSALKRARHVWLERIFGCLTHHLFTQSGEDATTAVNEGIMSADSVTRLGNGVIIERFKQITATEISTWRERLKIPTNDVVVGIVGRMVEEKGYREFFLAAAELLSRHNELTFLIVGGTMEGDRDAFQQEIAQFLTDPILKQHMKFTGYSEEIPVLMNLMDIFVLPSYREGMPRSILEAMAASKPVVASNIRGCREEVIEGETGFLVPTRNAPVLAERLGWLIENEDLRRRLGEAGHKRARAEFHEQLVVERLLVTLDRLAIEKGLILPSGLAQHSSGLSSPL